MMNVLIAIPCLKTGGTEIQALRLVEALVQGGYQVVTVCYFEYDFDMVQQYRMAGSKVECLSAFGNRPQGIKEQYRFLKKGLLRIVNEYQPDIAHVQYMAPGALPILILKRLGVRNIIATSHTMADIYKNLFLIKFLQKFVLRAFTCITENAEKSFFGSSSLFSRNTSLKHHNHFTIYNCLAPKYNIVNRNENRQSIRIGFVSRLEPIKGADFILPAFALLKQKYPQATLTVVGDGKMKDEMQRQQKELQLDVKWIDRQPYHRLPSIYQNIDYLWMPSRSEGFGLTAIEGMANGCVVIASTIGGLPEILPCKEWLCQPQDPCSLAETTIKVISSPSPCDIESHVRQYQFDNYSENILSLYSKISS